MTNNTHDFDNEERKRPEPNVNSMNNLALGLAGLGCTIMMLPFILLPLFILFMLLFS